MRDLPPVVPPEWVAAHLGEVVLADVRWYLDGRSGRAAFEAGHLPGAVFVDLDTDLSGPKGGVRGRHPLSTAAAFAEALGRLGIGERNVVVAYDDAGGACAGRLVWMLRGLGQLAALLDGGLGAWTGELETGPGVARPPVAVAPRPWPLGRLASADQLLEPGVVVLDARAPERYRGETEPVDPRAGHVPGARNAPWAANLDPVTGRLLPAERLRAHYEALGANDEADVVVYCGSGVSACLDLLALERSGIPARLFVPSWSGWSADPANPVAVGADP